MKKLILGLLLASSFAFAQYPVTASRITRGAGVPSSGLCAVANDVSKVYIRRDAAAANSSFYVCANTGVATYAWELQGGGGGGASPAGSATELQGRLNASTFGAIAGSANTAAIADPSAPAVAPTCAGTCVTDYGYRVVKFNGIGFATSAETLVMNAASMDAMHANTVTLPTDPASSCSVVRSTGPATGIVVAFTGCNGGTQIDQDQGFQFPLTSLPSGNTTGGLILGAFGFPSNPLSKLTFSVGGINPGNGASFSNNYTCFAGHQNFSVNDPFGNATNAYMGCEYSPSIGYYIETDLFQSDEIGPNKLVMTDANAIFKPGLGTSTDPIFTTVQAAFKSSDGTVGVSGATCSAWKDGLCVAN